MDPRFLNELQLIAKEAGRIAVAERKSISHSLKPDGSIVTNGDVAVEKFLRESLPDLDADAAFWGEEGGFECDAGKGLWLVDPVDGTSNYAFGSPLWGVSIGLLKDGQIRCGVIELPDLHETFAASEDTAATLNDVLLPPIPAGEIHDHEMIGYDERLINMFPNERIPGKMRHIGAFVIECGFVAAQRMRAMVAVRGKLYDFAAGFCIVRKLDAEVRYLDGSPVCDAELAQRDRNAKPIVIVPKGCTLGLNWR